jgi:hypothetical protein
MLHAKVPRRKADLLSLPDFAPLVKTHSPFISTLEGVLKRLKVSQSSIDSSMRQSAASENFRIDLTSRDIV